MFEIGSLQFTWRELIDIGVVALIYYNLILLVRGTRAVSVIYGLLVLLCVYYLSGEFGLHTLNWLLANFLGSIFLVVIILFKTDIRKALARLGAAGFWSTGKVKQEMLDELVDAFSAMAKKRVGAIVVLERSEPLGDIVERGVQVDAVVTKELLMTIFHPDTPLHDGAVVIQGGRVAAASCILPLTAGAGGRVAFGTRHRAALGISEECDAIAAVVSEERGEMSVAVSGRLTTSLDRVRLKRVLSNALKS